LLRLPVFLDFTSRRIGVVWIWIRQPDQLLDMLAELKSRCELPQVAARFQRHLRERFTLKLPRSRQNFVVDSN
jgi:hypothetical protein